MAISRIAGQMLQTNLERDGVNLSFSNLDLGNSTPVLYLDVGNNRVAINNSSASYTLDVTGNINASNNVYASNLSATANVVGGNVVSNNVYSSSGDLNLYSVSNGNILLTPDGTGFSKAVGTNGFVIPVGNTDQRPSTPDTGTLRFNTTLIQTEVWDGTAWVSATGGTSAIVNQTITGADGLTQTFNLDYSATAESILVTLNGVMQTPTTNYTTDTGNLTITFTEAPAVADLIQVRYIASTTVLSALVNGTSNVSIPVSGGNVLVTVGGVANVLTVANNGVSVLGNIIPSANVTYSLGSSTNRWSNLWIGGNTIYLGNLQLKENPANTFVVYQSDGVTPATIGGSGGISSTGNITGGNLIGTVYTNSIINSGANGTGNIGSSTGTFNTIFAKATSAQYADLAEFYSSDAEYSPGTVVSFGGKNEITLCNIDADPLVAGVVSTNPSYIMNAGINATFPIQVALTGRVPCRVVGPVTKGAMMVSAGNGCARAEKTPAMGTVIGKALEAFDGAEGTIEIVVGRL